MRWPEGPPRLALNPPYFVVVFFFCLVFFLGGGGCFCFLSLLLIEKKPVFLLKNAIFAYLRVSPFVSP